MSNFVLVMRNLALLLVVAFLFACSDNDGVSPAGTEPGNPFDSDSSAPHLLDATTRELATAYEPSEYTPNVMACAVLIREDEACTFEDLPLIGMTTQDPAVSDVMGRLIVTHDWMGDRFRDLLMNWPPSILLMTRGVTAVVISSEIRPSFYTTRTGAIYLDPALLAISESERDTISDQPDPRADDIAQFQFRVLWRYMDGNTDIRDFGDGRNRVEKLAGGLMVHELAHANDYFPPARVASIDRTVPIFNAYSTPDLPSSRLAGVYPLTSDFMRSLAQAAFHGQPATDQQLATTATDVAGEFPTDIANDYYNYSTQREDLAMTFEEVMMLHAFSVARDVAVVEFPDDVEFCDELIVRWGERRRIASPEIRDRAEFAVQRILPELIDAVDATLDGWSDATPMPAGLDWCTNRDLDFFGTATASPLVTESARLPADRHSEALVPWR